MKNIYVKQRATLEFQVPYKTRLNKLKKLKTLLLKYENELLEALFLDLNKHKNEAFVSEFSLLYSELNHNIKKLKKWLKPKKIKTPFYLLNSKTKIELQPLGQVLILSPWNFPVFLTISPIISALSAGNKIIVKPSEHTSNTSKVLKELLDNFDSNWIYCTKPDLENAKWLLEQKFDLIFFTGSTNVGQIVYSQAAKHLTPVVLELGGKCPVIIDQNLNLDPIIENILEAKMLNFGQTCIAPDFLIVHKKEVDNIKKVLNTKINEFSKYNDFAKIINSNHEQRLINLGWNNNELLTYFDSGNGTNQIKKLFGERAFSFAKPEELIYDILTIGTSKGDWVLDFFMGSGTTTAVAHKMNRRYIGIEQMDYIEDIAVSRLKKVIDGEQGGISKAINWQGGGSFVYCQLLEDANSLIKEIESADETSINDIKEKVYADERIVPYIQTSELEKVDNDFNELSLEEKKNALCMLIDKNKLYVNLSEMDDFKYVVSDSDKKFTKSFYKEV